jgi:hypothetical protein
MLFAGERDQEFQPVDHGSLYAWVDCNVKF